MGTADRIREIEEQMRKAQYNKATEHWFGLMKAQIARLREKMTLQASKGGSSHGFSVKKTGDASVILLGFPSVGKSTLLNKLTKARSATAAYAFTTLTVIPGLMEYNNAKIQILDVPGIMSGAAVGRGRGKEVLSCVHNADLVLMVVDALNPEQLDALRKELFAVNVRINQVRPDVKIERRDRGGLSITSTVPLTRLSQETAEQVLREFRINNADVVIREDIDVDQLIDVIQGNRKYVPALVTVSKIDLVDGKERERVRKVLHPDVMFSAQSGENIAQLKEAIFDALRFMRVFLKEVGKKPDLDEPMIVQKGSTLETVCRRIHRDFVRKFRFARIWGKSAKFPGQQFNKLEKSLQDGDIVEIHIK